MRTKSRRLTVSCISVLLIAAIFFKRLPIQFSSILSTLLPAMTGGDNLMVMGIYGYLSGTTAPENRTFRFGIFEQFVTFIPIVFLPLAGYLHARIGYESKSVHPYTVNPTNKLPFVRRILPIMLFHNSRGHQFHHICNG